MKYLFLIIVLFVVSCTTTKDLIPTTTELVIVEKTYDGRNLYMPDGICEFTAQPFDRNVWYTFQCPCDNHSNGDTIYLYKFNCVEYLIY